MPQRITAALWAAAAIIAAYLGFQWLESRIETGIYRDRLRDLSQTYEQLRSQYNQAIRRTAITELVVENHRVSVAVRTADGQRKTTPTPFDPANEIYVDYVVIDGRLWIRRIFDAKTTPENAIVIDPHFESVDWDSKTALHGKAIYRSLDDGRWVITVTGDGSLGLTRLDSDLAPTLAPPPPVKDYPQLENEIDHEIDRIGFTDVLRRMF
jgi:hypothetical protein